MTFVISRIFVPSGACWTHSTTTPTIDLFRKGTSTRLPGCTESRRISGIAYVNVVRSGTGNATLQNGRFISACSVSAGGNDPENDRGKYVTPLSRTKR